MRGGTVARAPASGQTKPSAGTREQTRQPPLFKVLMHNDDYTSSLCRYEKIFRMNKCLIFRVMFAGRCF